MAAPIADQLKKLGILGSICQNDKLCTQKGTIDVYRPSSYRGVQRWWTGETRTVNLQHVQSILERATDTVTLLIERGRSAGPAPVASALAALDRFDLEQTTRELTVALERAADGLSNLGETYKDDYATSAEIRHLVAQTRQFVERASSVKGSPLSGASTPPRIVDGLQLARPAAAPSPPSSGGGSPR